MQPQRPLLNYKISVGPTSIAVALPTEAGEVFGGWRVTGSGVAAAAEATRLVAAKKSRLTVTYWPPPSMPGYVGSSLNLEKIRQSER